MLLRDLIEQAFGSLAAQQAPEWADSSAALDGFVVSPYDVEFRARQGSSFQVGISATGGNVSPSNVILFNPAASRTVVILKQLFANINNATVQSLFSLAADPALAAGPTGINKLLAGPPPKAITERADAATPANTGVLFTAAFALNFVQDLVLGRPLILPPGTGVNMQFQTSPNNYQVIFAWDELPL
jgi:hypothetical protein